MSLTAALRAAKSEGRTLLLPYLMAGVPTREATVDLFMAMAEAGADGFEVGIPYADPLMDGPVIEAAGRLALSSGTTFGRGMELAAEVADRTGLPCVVMTYVNPILRRGYEHFCAEVAAAGLDGVIAADLPVDEGEPLAIAARRAGISLIPLVAPTTSPERIARAATMEPAFIYAVAELGVTGERAGPNVRAAELVARIRKVTEIPVGVGVGISTPEQARNAATAADAVIVGTAVVRRVLEAGSSGEATRALADLVSSLRVAID
jgi:tryptophan synthase alpha chain